MWKWVRCQRQSSCVFNVVDETHKISGFVYVPLQEGKYVGRMMLHTRLMNQQVIIETRFSMLKIEL